MTPATPLTYLHRKMDNFRTPGQILSLRSSLAFSTKKVDYSSGESSVGTTPCIKGSKSCQSLSTMMEKSPLGQSRLSRQLTMRDKLLSQSATKHQSQSVAMTTPGSVRSTPPVKRLMSTLQDSLNWSRSTLDETDHSMPYFSDKSKHNISECRRSVRPLGLSFAGVDSVGMSIQTCSDAYSGNSELTDSVFDTRNSNGLSVDSQDLNSPSVFDSSCGSCSCQQQEGSAVACSECRSHLKVPSRQQSLSDDTPQMHRTDESVWNSYAAKNLRSFQLGSYCEDSELSINDTDTTASFNSPLSKPLCKESQNLWNLKTREGVKPRRLIKSKSFCYLSDEETDNSTPGRYSQRVKFARKRSFQHVQQSPVRRTHSMESGLTQELRLFGICGREPCPKRSSSVPRTRIRFHSGAGVDKDRDTQSDASSLSTSRKSKADVMLDDFVTLSDSDKIISLSADETRPIPDSSESFITDSDRASNVDASATCDINTSEFCQTQNTSVHEMASPCALITDTDNDQQCDDSARLDTDFGSRDDVVIGGHKPTFTFMPKRVADLKKVTSSSVCLDSETQHQRMKSDLSSISGGDSPLLSLNISVSTDGSVFSTEHTDVKGSPSDMEVNRSRSPSPPVMQQEPPSTPLLPPPPLPKSRRWSGQLTPGVLRFAPVLTQNAPGDFDDAGKQNLWGGDVPMTPEPPPRSKVVFNTPNLRYTPQTPVQQPFSRSYSFATTMKTPYRTPKSVRRAQPLVEEERILGTPDYLAPEILQQKSHGPSVDWWALGICLFEFLTGVPPFNDQTPDLVFANILERDIPWPEGEEALTEEARAAIDAMLTMDPELRPGGRGVRKLAVFQDIDWHNLLDMEPPFVPEPRDLTDTSYFDARNVMQDLFVSDVDF